MRLHQIFTCSIGGPEHEDERYHACISDTIQKLRDFPISFYVVENNGKRKTILDTIEGAHIIYTDSNILELSNGKKELSDIHHVIKLYDINDNDIIIKQTGRYPIRRHTFIELVDSFKDVADVFMKFYDLCQNTFRYKDCVMGLYAVRAYVLKGYIKHLLPTDEVCEVSLASYIRDTVPADKIMEIKFLEIYFRGIPTIHI